MPDLAAFPRAAWLAAMRRVLRDLPDARLSHPDPRGAAGLRSALAAYLGRVRGVVTTPDRMVVATGFWQGLASSARRWPRAAPPALAMEDPSFVYHRHVVRARRARARPRPGRRTRPARRRARPPACDAVLVTPAHQSPTGVVLAPERRTALVAWAHEPTR